MYGGKCAQKRKGVGIQKAVENRNTEPHHRSACGEKKKICGIKKEETIRAGIRSISPKTANLKAGKKSKKC
jgi:hypothetical protein